MFIQQHINLAPYTTYKIGGPARWFVRVQTENDLCYAVAWAHRKRVPYFVLGGGSNVLISDRGYNGLVIFLQNTKYKIQNTALAADAGVLMQDLVSASVEAGLAGLEWAGGLPGTLGGAIYGNAGAFGGAIKDNIASVCVFTPQGEFHDFDLKACSFAYRTSLFKECPGHIIYSAVFKLQEGLKEQLKARVAELIHWRQTKHPIDYGNCGSVFKRPYVADLPSQFLQQYPDAGTAVREDQLATAWLIDKVGLKKIRVGGAEISEKHPNFIINRTGKARAEDVMMLASFAKSKVLQKFGVQLEEEVQRIGF